MADKLWHGRFEAPPSKITEEISESISYDNALYKVDIRASLAHARMLQSVGVITSEDLRQIETGLAQVLAEIEAGKMHFSAALEEAEDRLAAAAPGAAIPQQVEPPLATDQPAEPQNPPSA